MFMQPTASCESLMLMVYAIRASQHRSGCCLQQRDTRIEMSLWFRQALSLYVTQWPLHIWQCGHRVITMTCASSHRSVKWSLMMMSNPWYWGPNVRYVWLWDGRRNDILHILQFTSSECGLCVRPWISSYNVLLFLNGVIKLWSWMSQYTLKIVRDIQLSVYRLFGGTYHLLMCSIATNMPNTMTTFMFLFIMIFKLINTFLLVCFFNNREFATGSYYSLDWCEGDFQNIDFVVGAHACYIPLWASYHRTNLVFVSVVFPDSFCCRESVYNRRP
jgi:hypothetical protein